MILCVDHSGVKLHARLAKYSSIQAKPGTDRLPAYFTCLVIVRFRFTISVGSMEVCCVITSVIRQHPLPWRDATCANAAAPPASVPGYQATAGMRAEQAVRDVLPGHPLARHIDDFLTDLANANKPRNTIRAYRGDLTGFAAHHDGDIAGLTAAPVRAFLGEIAGQAPATRKRKRAAVASFCKWAVRHELLDASPMDRIDTIEVPRTLPRPAAAADVAAVLDAICSRRPRKDVPVGVLRDRVLFETAYVCGARASEVCGMYVEDLDLRPDDEHARLHGKGGTVRTVLLDDRGYVALLRLYLARAGYTSGPLFRAQHQRPGRPAVLRRGAQPVEEVLRRRRRRDRHPPAPPRARHRADQQRRVHRGRPPPPRPRLHRDHPGLHPARRPGRRRRDPRRTPQTRDQTPMTDPGPVRVSPKGR